MNSDVSLALQRWREGDAFALDALLPSVYADLRALAARRLADHPEQRTLQPTALLNEVFVRLLGAPGVDIVDREHLFRLAARTMRNILIDRARRVASDKHGGHLRREDIGELLHLPLPEASELAALDTAISELERLDARLAQVVELRYFVGLSVAEVADVMGVDERTVYRDWALARGWLRAHLDSR